MFAAAYNSSTFDSSILFARVWILHKKFAEKLPVLKALSSVRKLLQKFVVKNDELVKLAHSMLSLCPVIGAVRINLGDIIQIIRVVAVNLS